MRIIRLLSMFLIAVLTLSSCFIQIPDKQSFRVKNGIIDITEYNFKSAKPLYLLGDWKFQWINQAHPAHNDSGGDTIKVPSFWNDKTGKAHGVGWLHLTIHRPVDKRLGLYLEGSLTSYELYVNGKLLATNGVIGKDKSTSIPKRKPVLVPLPDENPLLLTWKIANYYDSFGGPDRCPSIGLYDRMLVNNYRMIFFDILIIGAIMIMAFHYLILWIMRKKERAHIYFAICCLTFLMRVIVGNHHFSIFFPFENVILFEIRNKFEYLFPYYGWIMIPFLVDSLYPTNINKLFIKATIVLTGFYTAFILSFPVNIYSRFLYVYQIILIVIGLWTITTLIFGIIKNQKHFLLILAGFVIFNLTVVNDILYSSKIILSYNLIHVGLFVFIVANSIILSRRFSTALTQAEYLSANLQKEVTRQTQELADAKEQQERFIINVAHETKTPITLINNLLKSYFKDRIPNTDVKIILNNVAYLKKLIMNVFDVLAIKKGKIQYDHSTVVNLTTYINDILKMFKNVAHEKGIKLSFKSANTQAQTKIDPLALNNILTNLIENALKYSSTNDTVEISMTDTPSHTIVIIKDNGSGIKKDLQPHIFDPFYQASRKKSNTQGIGMGLFIVKEILEQVHGSITCMSMESVGTTFTVSFQKAATNGTDIPITSMQATIDIPEHNVNKVPGEDNRANGRMSTILLVEDNRDMVYSLQQLFQADYQVYYALNGKEALNLLARIPRPDIIISDIMMNEMDGEEFYNELLANATYASIPFIFLTAKTGADDRLNNLRRGAVDFIQKPFENEELKAKVASLINQDNQLRKAYLAGIQEKHSLKLLDEQEYLDGKLMTPDEKRVQDNEKLIELILQRYKDKKFSTTDLEILTCLKEDISREEISTITGKTLPNVNHYLSRLYKKLSINGKDKFKLLNQRIKNLYKSLI